jgi:hypothetical protein
VNLAELQRLFYERASGAVEGPVAWAVPAARIQVYADMFVWRQIDALREDFPKLVALLGDGPFYAIAEAYLRAHPSTHHSLAQLGRRFAGFLAEQPRPSEPGLVLGAEQARPSEPGLGNPEQGAWREDLADLAALEWARSEVFEEALAAAALPDALLQAGPLERARLTMVPALRLLSLGHDPVSLWLALDQGGAPPEPVATACKIVVWRARGFEVFHAAIPEDEAIALQRALASEPLGAVCAAFEGRADPAAAALEAIGSWFVEEMVHAVVPDAGETP